MPYPSFRPLCEMKIALAWTALALCGAALVFVGYINFDNIVGAFGSGPPYYGRTTNMDKWQDPLPYLIVVDLVSATCAWFAARWAVRLIHKGRR